jgi:hypothetical protein
LETYLSVLRGQDVRETYVIPKKVADVCYGREGSPKHVLDKSHALGWSNAGRLGERASPHGLRFEEIREQSGCIRKGVQVCEMHSVSTLTESLRTGGRRTDIAKDEH